MTATYIQDYLEGEVIKKYGKLEINCTLEHVLEYYHFFISNIFSNSKTYFQINVNNYCFRKLENIIDFSYEHFRLNKEDFLNKYYFWVEHFKKD